jgi:SAM-dependent methyltransferase
MSDALAIRNFEYAGWEQAADTYEAGFAVATASFVPALLDAGGVVSGRTVLDVACGPGLVTEAAASRGAIVRGLDFSPSMLRVARLRQPEIMFDEGDAESLPYPEAQFDVVVSNFGIHHVARPVMALRDAHRVLRSGGMVAFTVWASPEDNIAWKLVFDAIRRHGDMQASRAPVPGGDFRTPDDCEAALRTAGFADVGHARLDAVWHNSDAKALLTALRGGTARMAALIKAQSDAVIDGVITDIERNASRFRQQGQLAIPTAAFVAFGRRLS